MRLSRFYFLCSATAVAALLCSCTLAQREATDSQRKEAGALIDRLEWAPGARGQHPSIEVSNRMTGLKQPVVLVLLERISSISYTNENEMERVGIACRILGTNAYPVLLEVMKGFASEDPDRRSSSSVVMQIAGPVSFGPAIEFLKANAEGTGQEMIRSDILYLIQIFPEASIAELLRLYRVANKPSEVKEYLALGFQEAVGQQDCELLIPFLKPLLRDNDPFIVLSTLEYVKRCGPTASGAREELFRLLQSSNPEIRVEATNAVQLISRND